MSLADVGYHVTLKRSAESILKTGLQMSEDGNEGPGVYLWIEDPNARRPRAQMLQNVMDHIYEYLMDGIYEEYPEDVGVDPEKYFTLLKVDLRNNPATEGMKQLEDSVVLVHNVEPKYISEVHGWNEQHTQLFS